MVAVAVVLPSLFAVRSLRVSAVKRLSLSFALCVSLLAVLFTITILARSIHSVSVSIGFVRVLRGRAFRTRIAVFASLRSISVALLERDSEPVFFFFSSFFLPF